MAFNDIELKRIERFVGDLCRRRSPAKFRDKLSLEYRVHGHDVIVFERRPRYRGQPGYTESPVAKLKFVRSVGEWRLYWQRADLEWHGYEPLPASRDLGELVAEIDADPSCCFFG